MVTEVDVAIIGAGPAGLFLSRELTQQGLQTVVLEAKPKIKRKFCGDYICAAGTEILLDSGLENIVSLSRPVEDIRIVSQKGMALDLKTPEPRFGLSISREVFDNALLSEARKAGAMVYFGERMRNLRRTIGGFVVETEGRSLVCKLLVGADGRQSSVAKSLRLTRKSKSSMVGLRAFFATPNHRKGIELHLLNGAYVGVNHLHGGQSSLALVLDRQEFKRHRHAREAFFQRLRRSEKLFSDYLLGEEPQQVESVYPLEHHVIAPVGQSFALVGDAAGYAGPLTGEGNYMALLSSKLLSESLSEVDGFGPNSNQALFRYHQAYLREIQKKFWLNYLFQWMIKSPRWTEALIQRTSRRTQRREAFTTVICNTGPIKSSVMGWLL